MQQSFFVLSGQNIELAQDEVVSISKSYDPKTRYKTESNLVVVQSSTLWNKIAKRAAFVKIAGRIATTFTAPSKISLPVPKPVSFACRTINLSSEKIDSPSISKEAGTILKKRWNSKVSLTNPALVVYLIITDSTRYLGYSDNTVEPTRPHKLIKHPHELDWKLSRAMVNLSQLKEKQTLCDPFCGTGTILLEAQSMGLYGIGIDFDKYMCSISEKNLLANRYTPKITNSTYHHVQNIKDKIDAIVTNIPYGVASKSSSSPKRIIQDFLSIIPKKMKLVLVYKKGVEVDELSKAKKYEVYRHKSLTRVIAVR